jgi:hypothetical protein
MRPLVQHFLICPRITVSVASPDNPYTLHDVNYRLDFEADREFPIVEPELWVYLRAVRGEGVKQLAVRVEWLDGPNGVEEVGVYALPPVEFPDPNHVICRAWKLSYVRFPGTGRYLFSLCIGRKYRLLASELLEVWRPA